MTTREMLIEINAHISTLDNSIGSGERMVDSALDQIKYLRDTRAVAERKRNELLLQLESTVIPPASPAPGIPEHAGDDLLPPGSHDGANAGDN